MCRSIKVLRNPAAIAQANEIHAAALQFVRKISGYRVPSRANEAAFRQAVSEIAEASSKLLNQLHSHTPKVSALPLQNAAKLPREDTR